MNILFLGQTEGNTGPGNANASLLAHWPAEDHVIYADNKKTRLRICLTDIWRSDVCIITGYTRVARLAAYLCEMLDKPLVMICHGYLPFECDINRMPMPDSERRSQRALIHKCTLLSGVSEVQAEFLRNEFPEMTDRVRWHYNGVEPTITPKHTPLDHRVIAVTGGTRPIKNNDLVVRATQVLAESDPSIELRVYGRDYAGEGKKWVESLPASARYMGQVTHDEFLKQLAEVDLLVMASVHEPFGLSAVEGLQCGTSLLLSEHCGVAGILDLTPDDVIRDGMSDQDVALLMSHVLSHPNNQRLLSSVDFAHAGWDSSAARLRETCLEAMAIKRARHANRR